MPFGGSVGSQKLFKSFRHYTIEEFATVSIVFYRQTLTKQFSARNEAFTQGFIVFVWNAPVILKSLFTN